MSLPTPPAGTAIAPVPGEPTQEENIELAKGLLRMMPGGLSVDEQAEYLGGVLISSWRRGFWVGQQEPRDGR